MNKVILTGRLTRNPEIKYSQGTEPIGITNISLAVQRKFKKDGEPDADFMNCIAFGKTAELISKYCSKGKKIGVIGYFKTNSWTEENGAKKFATEVIIEEVEFLEKKEEKNNEEDKEDN